MRTAVMDHPPAGLHATVDRALTAAGREHTDLGDGFLVPAFMPFPMTDREAARWLADLGIQLTDNEKWPRGNQA